MTIDRWRKVIGDWCGYLPLEFRRLQNTLQRSRITTTNQLQRNYIMKSSEFYRATIIRLFEGEKREIEELEHLLINGVKLILGIHINTSRF